MQTYIFYRGPEQLAPIFIALKGNIASAPFTPGEEDAQMASLLIYLRSTDSAIAGVLKVDEEHQHFVAGDDDFLEAHSNQLYFQEDDQLLDYDSYIKSNFS